MYIDAVSKIKELNRTGVNTEYRDIVCKHSRDWLYIADVSQKIAINEIFYKTSIADFYILLLEKCL